ARLRQELERTGVSVTRIGDNITLNMPGNITFATDSADLNAGFYDVLSSVALVLNEFEQTVIEVAGHTDSTGSDEYNQRLSERRAGRSDHRGRNGRGASDRVQRHARGPAAEPAGRADARAADAELGSSGQGGRRAPAAALMGSRSPLRRPPSSFSACRSRWLR